MKYFLPQSLKRLYFIGLAGVRIFISIKGAAAVKQSPKTDKPVARPNRSPCATRDKNYLIVPTYAPNMCHYLLTMKIRAK